MKKEHSINFKLLLNFLVLSIITLIVIFIVYIVYSRGVGKDYTLFTYILIGLGFYKSYIPYITSLSVYFAFFKGSFSNQENISKVIALPIVSIIFLVIFFTVYDYFLVDYFVSTIRHNNTVKNHKIYYDYELKLKNESYKKATEEFLNGNIDAAYIYAQNALFYDRNDINVLLLIKNIQHENIKRYELEHKEEISNINNLIRLGTREYSLHNYNIAYKYFNQIIKLDNNNPLALYYLNKISIARNEKPKYYGNTTKEISIYSKLFEAISLYESGRFWYAYDLIQKLYLEYSDVVEVDNYYSLIKDSIIRYDFFIDDAKKIKDAYIDNTELSVNSSSINYNGVNIMLDKNTLLSSVNSTVFKGDTYLFDVSIVSLDDELKMTNSDNYLYAKISDAYKATNNMKNIILKAHFDTNKNEYVYNDIDRVIIPIEISQSTINIIRNYTELKFSDISFFDLFILKEEISKFGYSSKDIMLELLYKVIEPITYLLLFIIIAYYSFRYRETMFNKKLHLYNVFVGIVGTCILTLVYSILIQYISISIYVLSHILISICIIYVISITSILIILLQMVRIPRDVR